MRAKEDRKVLGESYKPSLLCHKLNLYYVKSADDQYSSDDFMISASIYFDDNKHYKMCYGI